MTQRYKVSNKVGNVMMLNRAGKRRCYHYNLDCGHEFVHFIRVEDTCHYTRSILSCIDCEILIEDRNWVWKLWTRRGYRFMILDDSPITNDYQEAMNAIERGEITHDIFFMKGEI